MRTLSPNPASRSARSRGAMCSLAPPIELVEKLLVAVSGYFTPPGRPFATIGDCQFHARHEQAGSPSAARSCSLQDRPPNTAPVRATTSR